MSTLPPPNAAPDPWAAPAPPEHDRGVDGPDGATAWVPQGTGPAAPPPSGYEAVLEPSPVRDPYQGGSPYQGGAVHRPASTEIDPYRLPAAPPPQQPAGPYGTGYEYEYEYGNGYPTPYGAQAPYGYVPPPGPMAQPWGAAPQSYDGMAIASLVVGLVSFFTGMTFLGVVAVGLGIAALRRTSTAGTRGRGLAIAGIATGGLAALLTVAVVLYFVALFSV